MVVNKINMAYRLWGSSCHLIRGANAKGFLLSCAALLGEQTSWVAQIHLRNVWVFSTVVRFSILTMIIFRTFLCLLIVRVNVRIHRRRFLHEGWKNGVDFSNLIQSLRVDDEHCRRRNRWTSKVQQALGKAERAGFLYMKISLCTRIQ